MRRNYFWIALLLLLAPQLSRSQEKMVNTNGHNFNVYLKGFENRKKTAPVVILESGMGVDLGNWKPVMDDMAKFTPVFAYDRSGVGKSEKVFEYPTLKRVADNLKALLTALNIPPPYILVGHSMGGTYVRGYAGFYPNDVSALVFIDPADFTESKEEWSSIFRKIGVPEKRIDNMTYDRLYNFEKNEGVDSLHFGPWSESRVLGELRRTDFAELNDRPLPQVPVYFFVGGKFEVPPEKRSKEFDHPRFFIVKTDLNMEHWRRVIDSSEKGGALIYLSRCGHYVHRDDPKTVINTMKLIVENLKSE